LAGLVLVLAATAFTLVGCDPAPTLTLQPAVGAPGQVVSATATAHRFTPGEAVTIRFAGTLVGSATAGAHGALSTSFTVPMTATPGGHTVRARGTSSGATAVATFVVRTNWRQYGFDNARTGATPFEHVIGADNVAKLHELWNLSLANAANPGRSNPTVSDGVLYMSSYQHVVAIDLATHAVLWQGKTQSTIASSPLVNGGRVFVIDFLYRLYVFPVGCRSDGGECPLLWQSATSSVNLLSHPVAEKGVVYVGAARGVAAYSTSCGTGGATCAPLWTVDLGEFVTGPALHDGVLYVQSETQVFAVDIASRTVLWKAPAPGLSYADSSTEPAVGDGLVFVSTSADLYAFPVGCATDGGVCAPRWIGPAPGDEHPSSTPTIAGGRVFVQTAIGNVGGDDGHVEAFSTTCGSGGSTC
jgi:outer membrane protein assembly factor BamB